MTGEVRDGAPRVIPVDGMGVRCVQVLLRLRGVMAGEPTGTVCRVLTDDPAAELDLAAWCHLTGHTYLGPVPDPAGPAYELRLEAGGQETEPSRPWHPARQASEALGTQAGGHPGR
jgi:tRNA 2-thiouridine synthesizing protein A